MNKFMTLPTKLLVELTAYEMVHIAGGNTQPGGSPNNGSGKCSGPNNADGKCSGPNNDKGTCG